MMEGSNMTSLKSSNIAGVDYDEGTKRLVVHFRNGSQYQYADVPQVLVNEFVLAASPGQFFHRKIRQAFPAVKLNVDMDMDT